MYIVLTYNNLIATTRKPTRFIFINSIVFLQDISLFNLYYRVVMHIACSVFSIQNVINTYRKNGFVRYVFTYVTVFNIIRAGILNHCCYTYK